MRTANNSCCHIPLFLPFISWGLPFAPISLRVLIKVCERNFLQNWISTTTCTSCLRCSALQLHPCRFQVAAARAHLPSLAKRRTSTVLPSLSPIKTKPPSPSLLLYLLRNPRSPNNKNRPLRSPSTAFTDFSCVGFYIPLLLSCS